MWVSHCSHMILWKFLRSRPREFVGSIAFSWSDAVDVELSQMEKVNAWIPVVLLPDANIILSHYVFCCKHDAAGNVACYKAWLVVKGFRQQFGVNYVETFAPTVWASTLWILLSFAAQKNAAVHQCDIKNVYLNSCLQDGVNLYSSLPLKYENFRQLPLELKGKVKVVCKWLVGVYGSKQGAHAWPRWKVSSWISGTRYLLQMKPCSIYIMVTNSLSLPPLLMILLSLQTPLRVPTISSKSSLPHALRFQTSAPSIGFSASASHATSKTKLFHWVNRCMSNRSSHDSVFKMSRLLSPPWSPELTSALILLPYHQCFSHPPKRPNIEKSSAHWCMLLLWCTWTLHFLSPLYPNILMHLEWHTSSL